MPLIVTLHRYIGIAVGWLIAVWCLSGIVMIYVPYPSVSLEDHVEALPILDLSSCCTSADDTDWSQQASYESFSIEMRGGTPILSLQGPFGGKRQIALDSGRELGPVSAEEAVQIATARSAHWPGRGDVSYLSEVIRDQWTVGYYRPDRSLHRVSLGDSAGTQWYLDGRDGELVQATSARERGWNWIGSVAHWLYLTPLRKTGIIWANTVIWSTIIALFLTLVGVYLGIARLRLTGETRLSPFRGIAMWHHYLGLVFGVLACTWLISGLLSMNPWGLLEGSSARPEIARLEGDAISGNLLAKLLPVLADLQIPTATTYIESAPFLGKLYLIAYDRSHNRYRLSGDTYDPAPLGRVELEAAADRLRPGETVLSAELMYTPDAYYYDQKASRSWPVFKIQYDDAEQTRYYIDTVSGEVLARVDATSAAYRWLFTALHSLDFASILRTRPLWDALMILLLSGVAATSATGTFLGIRYLYRVGRKRETRFA
jgi:hypothetical protein